jgi:hypothetical protein
MRVRQRGVANVRGDQNAATRVESEPVRLHAYSDLERVSLGAWRKHRNSVFASIGCNDEITRLGHERTRDPCKCRDGFNVSISRDVDDVDRIVAGVRDVEPIRGWMDISVIESPAPSIRRELDVTE